jgi:hypothetical protein
MSTYKTSYPFTGNLYSAGSVGIGIANGINYNQSAYSYTTTGAWTTSSSNVIIGTDGDTSLRVNGDTNISGNLTVGGTNITVVLNDIQRQLGLLTPNPALEEEFDQLRLLAEQYRALEAHLLEQKRVWDILKKE